MNILLVEDSATLRFGLETYLASEGHTPLTAENGEKAVQMVENETIDMILMDVEMPGLNGFETTKLIRENNQDSWIPIIFVTSKSDETSVEEGIAAGGDDYLIKPVSKVILLAKIRAMERIANMRNEMRQLNIELTKLSEHDGLTQLLNRRTFDERARETWRMASRTKQPLAILLFDIDYFKKYNDTYGHQAGDDCIRLIAQTIKKCCHRPGDIVARYGGEEFIVLLPNTDLKGAQHVAETLRSAIEQKKLEHTASDEYHVVTVSVGGCVIKYTTGTNIEDIIACADEALYRCKSGGRNTTDVSMFKNLHDVLHIDCSVQPSNQLQGLLEQHCKLELVDSEHSLNRLSPLYAPKLVVLSVEHAEDPSLVVFKKLRDKLRLNVVPLLLMSSLEHSKLQLIGKSLAANGSIQTPLEKHSTIAKIDQYIGSRYVTP